jgi:hypothetical protein
MCAYAPPPPPLPAISNSGGGSRPHIGKGPGPHTKIQQQQCMGSAHDPPLPPPQTAAVPPAGVPWRAGCGVRTSSSPSPRCSSAHVGQAPLLNLPAARRSACSRTSCLRGPSRPTHISPHNTHPYKMPICTLQCNTLAPPFGERGITINNQTAVNYTPGASGGGTPMDT